MMKLREEVAALTKGEQIPQTVEHMQAIMERDAIALEDAHKEITALKVRLAKLERKLLQRKSAQGVG